MCRVQSSFGQAETADITLTTATVMDTPTVSSLYLYPQPPRYYLYLVKYLSRMVYIYLSIYIYIYILSHPGTVYEQKKKI